MNAYNDLYEAIEELIKNTDISSYQINKDTGVSYGNINAMRRGERSIENLTLKNAKKLYDYQNQKITNNMV